MTVARKILSKEFKDKVAEDIDVIAVILFGGAAKRKIFSDIDLCIVLNPGDYSNLAMSKKRLEYLAFLGDEFDVHIFQQLPLQVRVRILKEGRIILCKNEDSLYDLAYQTVKDFEHFRRVQSYYLEGVARA